MYLNTDYYDTPNHLPREQDARPKKFRMPARPDRIPPGTPRVPLKRLPKYLPAPLRRRLLRRLIPLPPIIGVPLLLYDVYETLEPHWTKHWEPWKPMGPWYQVSDCGRRPGSPKYGGNNNNGPYYEIRSGHVANCFSGQVPASNRGKWDVAFTKIKLGTFTTGGSNWTMMLSDSQLTPALRMRHDVTWWKNAGVPGDYGVEYTPYVATHLDTRWRMPDPNKMRWRWEYYREPLNEPTPPEPVPDEAPPWRWTPNDGGPPPRMHTRQPPKRGTREKKVLSRAAKVGIFLWKMMDNVSELSEIAGAFYDALPAEVREKYGCADGINIGQYGSDLNACRAEAIWNNLDKIDPNEAFMNVAKNVAEDMTIGAFHRFMSKVSPPGFSWERTAITHGLSKLKPEAYIAGQLKALFEFLGLEETEK